METLESLYSKREKLKYLINIKRSEMLIAKMKEKIKRYKELETLNNELRLLEKEIIDNSKPIISDNEIELIEGLESSFKRFLIRLKNTNIIVGWIEWRGYHYNAILGDVGYIIEKEYRGHNYAYKALCLLGNLLNSIGINDFWITASTTNKASLKTIMKFGGDCVSLIGNIVLFVCTTSPHKEAKLIKNN